MLECVGRGYRACEWYDVGSDGVRCAPSGMMSARVSRMDAGGE
jgi:hypothetical protein